MAWKVLITAPYFQPEIDRFMPIFKANNIKLVVPEVKERLGDVDLIPIVGDIDGVICGDDQFTEEVLEVAVHLKVISKWGTGIDSIDLDACDRLGITVRNTPNAFSDPVADSVMGYILCFARKLPWMHCDIRTGLWEKTLSVSLKESTLGVIGVGNVGKAVVRRALAFGMRVFGNDITKMPSEFLSDSGIKMVSKDLLLSIADFVSINCDLNPTSYHLIGEHELSQMKNSAVLINTARGPIVDESALERALADSQIAGAALDVFEKEPLPKTSTLRDFDNVLLAPHNANSSREARERVHQNTINNLLTELKRANE